MRIMVCCNTLQQAYAVRAILISTLIISKGLRHLFPAAVSQSAVCAFGDGNNRITCKILVSITILEVTKCKHVDGCSF